MSSVFISYRRTDRRDAVARIYEKLKGRLRGRDVFFDRTSLEFGSNFPEEIRTQVAGAGVVLVVIGPRWLELLKERRSAPVDHVREEVRLALLGGGQVVPVLVDEAMMPLAGELAEFPDLQPLASKNAIVIPPDPQFESGCEKLLAYLERTGPDEIVGSILAEKFKVLRNIGDGGMGEVFIAEQFQPVRRTVALKLIKLGMDSKEILSRFSAERQILATLDHPSICKVFDAGTTHGGRPFFAMEYVKGVPITQYCDEHKLELRERLSLFAAVCRAVQHAHTKGIVHRDIKPGNILVESVDGKAVPKVIDFGLAKVLGHQLSDQTRYVTEHGRWMGTVEYASPEQMGAPFDVQSQSDVYSLGVLLYELLTGTAPFSRKELAGSSEDVIKRMIREDEPSRPSIKLKSTHGLPTIATNRRLHPGTLQRMIRGRLDWIVMKALEKEPKRRYESAKEFADDVDNFLQDRPIKAERPSFGYRWRKFTARHRRPLIAAAVLTVALGFGFVAAADGDLAIPGGRSVRKLIDRYDLSVLRPVPDSSEVQVRAAEIRSRCREILLSRQDDRGWFCRTEFRGVVGKRPEISVWTHNQAMSAWLRDERLSGSERSTIDRCWELPFETEYWPITDEAARLYGWLGYDKCPYTLAQPSLWFHIAGAESLRASVATAPDDRERRIRRLESVQRALDVYYDQASGGWSMFPNQVEKAEHDPYCSSLGLIALLDSKAAGLGWHGDADLLDRMISNTASYLLSSFHDRNAVPGWATSTATNLSADGLTIQCYAVLLRAEVEAGVVLPPPLLDALELHAASFKERTIDYPDTAGQIVREFRDHTGEVRRVQESVNFLWYPWAVELTGRRLARLGRHGAATETLVETKRTLGRLVLGLGAGALARAENGNTFLTSELLYCLTSVPEW